MHEFGVPDAVARATGMVKSFGQKLDADLPDDIVTEVQLVAAIEELSKELNQVNEAVGQAEGAFRVQRNALSERTSGKQQRIEKLKKEVIIPLVSRLDATRESIRVGPSAFHHSLHVIAAEEAVEAARRKLEQEWVLLQDVDVLNASSIEQELVPGCESVQNQAVALTESLDTLEAKLDTLRKEIEELKSGLADLPETTPFLQFEAKLHEVIDAQGREDTPEIQTAKERLARVRAYQRISNAESAAIKSRDPLPLRKLLSELDSASRTADPLLFSTKEAQDIRASAVSVAEQLEAEGNLYSAVLRHHDSRDKLSGALAEACRLSDLGSWTVCCVLAAVLLAAVCPPRNCWGCRSLRAPTAFVCATYFFVSWFIRVTQEAKVPSRAKFTAKLYNYSMRTTRNISLNNCKQPLKRPVYPATRHLCVMSL
eukprot:INCI4036.4.p1 GENE.INCI4036.4~~INCI4036.4.p1  ORF type:complete len:427 (+),score=77.87 INCI4036.4:1119-2399(+)